MTFCTCSPHRGDPEHPILSGSSPCTWSTPTTATTLATLWAFHDLGIHAHVNIHDYIRHLKHDADGVVTDHLKVRIAGEPVYQR